MLTQIESTEQFESALNGYSPLLVEFFQPWCKYCQAFFPTLKEFAAQETIPVIQVSVRNSRRFSMPTVWIHSPR